MSKSIFQNLFDKLGGRKFFLVLLVFLTSSLYLWFEVLLKTDYVKLVQMLLVIYPAGAIGQSLLVKTDDSIDTKTDDIRKFLFTCSVFIAAATLFYFKKIDSVHYIELCQWLVGIYIAGNVAGKAVDSGINFTFNKKSTT